MGIIETMKNAVKCKMLMKSIILKFMMDSLFLYHCWDLSFPFSTIRIFAFLNFPFVQFFVWFSQILWKMNIP